MEDALQAREQQQAINNRPIIEAQAALNLTEFARKSDDLPIDGDHIQPLINKLIVSPFIAVHLNELTMSGRVKHLPKSWQWLPTANKNPNSNTET